MEILLVNVFMLMMSSVYIAREKASAVVIILS